MCWYRFGMQPIRYYLDSRHSTAVRLRRAAILLVCVYALGMLVLFLGVEACSALVRAEIIDISTAIGIGVIVGAFWFWFVVVELPHIRLPSLPNSNIAPSLALCVLSVAFTSFTPTVPKSPPRSVSFAI